ncbi:MAG: flagellar motor switch protein FliN, partial [Planctomycetota bacterium]
EDIDELMKALGVDPARTGGPQPPPPAAAAPPPSPQPVPLEPLVAAPAARPEAGLDLLNDVSVQVRIELGSARMTVQDILKLGPGSVVGLESSISDPIQVYVNDRLVARGEVLVLNDNFAVRITEVLPQTDLEAK